MLALALCLFPCPRQNFCPVSFYTSVKRNTLDSKLNKRGTLSFVHFSLSLAECTYLIHTRVYIINKEKNKYTNIIRGERELLNRLNLSGKHGEVCAVEHRALRFHILVVVGDFWKGVKFITYHFFISHASL